jgi:eukaryotic-like serine/threonine-protein kinase
LQFIKFLKSKLFWGNVAGAVILIVLIIMFTMNWLEKYTNFGETITVPDLKGMSMEQVERQLKSKNLEYAILDSLYDKDLKPSAVIDQNPKPNSKVKENRTIYLTINAFNPPEFKMPNLIDKSLRQAMMELESYGLKVGKLEYVPDMAQNAVLKQLINGIPVKPGDMVAKGIAIDLILGDGLGNTIVEIPLLLNLTISEAKFVLTGSSLNLGAVVYSGNVKDSARAVIYKQIPSPFKAKTIHMGESVDVFVAPEFPDSLRYLLELQNPDTNIPLDDEIDSE